MKFAQLLKLKKAHFSPSISTLSIMLCCSFLVSGCQSLSSKTDNDLWLAKIKQTELPKHKTDVTDDDLRKAIPKTDYYQNIWDELKTQFYLTHEHMGKYDRYIQFYSKRNRHIETISQRAEPYLFYIFSEIKRREMPYEIALLPAVESGFQANAKSHMRAVGLWQFIPSTADIFDLHQNWWYDGRKDAVRSTNAALDYLEKLYKLNNNDWLLALASYNGGLGNVYKAQKKFRHDNPTISNVKSYQPNYWEIQKYLPKETQNYVPKLLALSYVFEASSKFNLNIEPIKNQPYFALIDLDKPVALNQVAKLSGVDKAEITQLNSAYLRMATPPNGPHQIILPVSNAQKFKAAIKQNPAIFNIVWQKHKIKSGDSLSVIARNYKTSSTAIKSLNGMRSSNIRAGSTILIPIPADAYQSVKHTQLATQTSTPNLNNQTSTQLSGYHSVKSGDSLWKLAKNYQVSTKQIRAWNGLDSNTTLQIGQKLKIYSDQFGKKIVHTIQPGESLWIVAKKYQVNTQKIALWNRISIKSVLQPGLKLDIWVKPNQLLTLHNGRYTVKAGDNLWLIAKANKLSVKTLAAYNNLSLKSLLKPGQILKIPSRI